ncbi:phage antirepressor N-terminal domain-containing protein [Streptosporangium sp. NPDC001559]|uniref:phage antirepressor N-terminal domain-containing protein n=1 Tax=Streptosporangium sp. NPDC001559 TaxID=3366187 RepID=UPI0036E77F3D
MRLSLGELHTVSEDDTLWVVFRPAVEALELDPDTQIRKLKTRSWARTGLRPVRLPGDPRTRQVTVVDRKTLTMWLATVNENNVAKAKRDQLIAYQQEATEALDRYWHEGMAVKPRTVEPEPVVQLPAPEPLEPITYPLIDSLVLMRQRFGVHLHIHDFTRTLRAGGVLRQDGRPMAKYGHLFWLKAKTGTYEVFEHAIEPLYRIYESTKLRLEMAAQRQLPLDPPGWPELPLGEAS